MRVRLRTKLMLAYLIPVVGLSLVAGLLVYRAANRALEAELGERLAAVARTVAAGFMATPDAGRVSRLDLDPESSVRRRLNQRLGRLQESTEVRSIFVVLPNLVSLLDSDPNVEPGTARFELESDRAELERLRTREVASASSVLFTDEHGDRYMNGYAPILHDDVVVGIVGVAGSAAFFTTLDDFLKGLGILGLLMVFLVGATTIVVAHRLTQPISALVEALRRYGRGELREPVEVRTRDEIGFLAEAFNEMRQTVDRRDEQMQLMLSGIAHEVRNPLAGMELFCSLLQDEIEPQSEASGHVGRITRELDYLSRVVNDFLNYARQRSMSPTRVRGDLLIEDVVTGLSMLAESRGVSVLVDVPNEMELTAEEEGVRGLCVNLIQNAIQACDDGGEVRVSMRASDLATGAEVRILVVEDTGKGIPEDQLKKIFEPFFTTREKGTGLGLALVNKMVQDHGGSIDAESTLGEGTRLVVTLPFDASLSPRLHKPDVVTTSDAGYEMIG